MLEQKQGQFWNLHRIPNKKSNPDFRLFFFISVFFWTKKKVIVIFIRKSSLIKKKKTVLVFFFLALIVFDFHSSEYSKTHFTRETNI